LPSLCRLELTEDRLCTCGIPSGAPGWRQKSYEAAGSSKLKPDADREMTMPYFNVPTAVLEDASELTRWTARAVSVESALKPVRTRKAGWRPSALHPNEHVVRGELETKLLRVNRPEPARQHQQGRA
jgi:hypothetical protein